MEGPLQDEVVGIKMEGAYEPPEEVDESVLPLPTFDPRWRDPLNGLLFLGNLKSEFTWPGTTGHRFVVRTITTDEYLRVAQIAKRHEGTVGDMRAYQVGIVAACLVSVDGQLPAVPTLVMGSETDARFEAMVAWALRQYQWTIDAVYNQFCILEHFVEETIAALGKSSGEPTAETPGSSPDFNSPEAADYLTVADPSIQFRS